MAREARKQHQQQQQQQPTILTTATSTTTNMLKPHRTLQKPYTSVTYFHFECHTSPRVASYFFEWFTCKCFDTGLQVNGGCGTAP